MSVWSLSSTSFMDFQIVLDFSGQILKYVFINQFWGLSLQFSFFPVLGRLWGVVLFAALTCRGTVLLKLYAQNTTAVGSPTRAWAVSAEAQRWGCSCVKRALDTIPLWPKAPRAGSPAVESVDASLTADSVCHHHWNHERPHWQILSVLLLCLDASKRALRFMLILLVLPPCPRT